MGSRDTLLHLKELSNNPYPDPNQPMPRIDTYFFKINFNIVLPSTPRTPEDIFPVGISVKIFKALLPSFILAT